MKCWFCALQRTQFSVTVYVMCYFKSSLCQVVITAGEFLLSLDSWKNSPRILFKHLVNVCKSSWSHFPHPYLSYRKHHISSHTSRYPERTLPNHSTDCSGPLSHIICASTLCMCSHQLGLRGLLLCMIDLSYLPLVSWFRGLSGFPSCLLNHFSLAWFWIGTFF